MDDPMNSTTPTPVVPAEPTQPTPTPTPVPADDLNDVKLPGEQPVTETPVTPAPQV